MNLLKKVLIVSVIMLVFPLISIAEDDPTMAWSYYPQEYMNMKNPLL